MKLKVGKHYYFSWANQMRYYAFLSELENGHYRFFDNSGYWHINETIVMPYSLVCEDDLSEFEIELINIQNH